MPEIDGQLSLPVIDWDCPWCHLQTDPAGVVTGWCEHCGSDPALAAYRKPGGRQVMADAQAAYRASQAAETERRRLYASSFGA